MIGKDLVYRQTDGRTDIRKTICPLFFEGGHNKSYLSDTIIINHLSGEEDILQQVVIVALLFVAIFLLLHLSNHGSILGNIRGEGTICKVNVNVYGWLLCFIVSNMIQCLSYYMYLISKEILKMLCLYLLTRIVNILLPYDTQAVNTTSINTQNCKIQLSMHVKILQKK